ncbi:MAG: hypothetical protein C4K58_06970 [Flavobacteriaceae bacterium]|nr:MAG: hypothetical protein C4K58_06970 [Flavobacteriaceae bacterium]
MPTNNPINLHKLDIADQIPAVLQAGGLYVKRKTASTADIFVASKTGERVDIVTDALIDDRIAQKLAQQGGAKFYDTIALRDASSPVNGSMAIVGDATADPTVSTGGAFYAYNGTVWKKLTEYESMDIDFSSIQIGWGQIPDVPDALNNIGEDANGDMTWKGDAVKPRWATEGF